MNSSFAILNEKLSKWESQNSAPKVVVQEKSEHSCAAKPKEVHNDSRSNSSLPSKIHDKKVVNQEKGPGATFFMRKNQFPKVTCQIPRHICHFPRDKRNTQGIHMRNNQFLKLKHHFPRTRNFFPRD